MWCQWPASVRGTVMVAGRSTRPLAFMWISARVGIAAVLAAGCVEASDPNGRESGTDKHESSILQVAEYKARGTIPGDPKLLVESGYDLLSVPSIDGSKRIFVMLWPKASPYYKQLPEGNYRISPSLLSELVRANKVSATVQEVLSGHLQ